MRSSTLLLLSFTILGLSCIEGARCFLDTQDLWIFGDLQVYTKPPSAGQRTNIDLNGVRFTIKSDGNLALVEIATNTELWTSRVSTQDCSGSGCRCGLQGDGNFVCSTGSGNPYWSTGTYNCCNNTRAADKAWFSSQKPYFQMVNTQCQIVWSTDNPLSRTQQTSFFGSTGWLTPTPTPAQQFISSFGVNTHLSQGWNLQSTITNANWAGASTIREGIADNLLDDYKQVAAAGLKLNLIIISHDNVNISDNIRILETAVTNSPGAVTSIEGFNELNNQPFVYNGVDPKTSYAGMAQAQKDFYSAIKASSILKNIPVYDLTAGNSGPDSASLGLQQLAGYADYANIHPYSYQGDNSIVGFSYFSSNMNGDYPTWQTSTHPKVITELGWPTLLYSGNSQGVSNISQAKLTVNTLMETIRTGYRQCFIYELWDESWGNPSNTEEHFGIFNHDNSPKPLATVLRTMTGLLKDNGTPSLPALNYSIDGVPLTTGHNLLFAQASSGSYWLAIWNDEAVWNPMSQTDVETQPYPLTVTLGSNSFSTADFTLYNPYSTVIAGSLPASQTFSKVNNIKFNGDDYLVLVQIKPN